MFWTSITCILILGAAPGRYDAYKGAADDEHGKIEWVSTVKKVANGYRYTRTVTNRAKTNSFVNWEPATIRSLIVPGDKAFTTSTFPMPPSTAKGPIRYAGGHAAGEGVKSTLVWTPVGFAASISSEARIFLTGTSSGKGYPVMIKAVSTVEPNAPKDKVVTLQLNVDGVPKEALGKAVRVSWDFAGTTTPVAGVTSKLIDGRFFGFKNGAAKITYRTSEQVVPREAAIKFFSSDGSEVAQVWLPTVGAKE